MDRARAIRLSLKCMAFIEQHAWRIKAQPEKTRKADPASASVITIQGSAIHLSPVIEMVARTDFKNRRGIDSWWAGFKDLAETMGSKNYFRTNEV
jgi:6-phosphofructokinase 1